MSVILLNSKDDLQWLKDVHIMPLLAASNARYPHQKPFRFKSAVLYGNEDYPGKIELYAKKNPLITDEPVVVFTQ